MKTNFIGALLAGFAISIIGCTSNTPPPQNHVVIVSAPAQVPQDIKVQPDANIPAGFNVPAFADMLKTSGDPNVLTQSLNSHPNNVNHLDLDGNTEIDYLRLDQTDPSQLIVFDELSPTQKVAICTLFVDKTNNSYQINGSPEYCGTTNNNYNSPSGMTFAQLAFLTWWVSPYHYNHPYHPGWGYHSNYGRNYHSYRQTGLYTQKEVTTVRKVFKNTPPANTNISKPTGNTNISKPVNNNIAPSTPIKQVPNVSSPTKSQKQLTADGDRYRANNVGKTNAFAPKTITPPPAPPKSTYVPKSNPAPTKSYGSSKSSFGGSSKSSFGGGGRRK